MDRRADPDPDDATPHGRPVLSRGTGKSPSQEDGAPPRDAEEARAEEEQHIKEEAEEQSVEEAARLTSVLVYEVIRRDGEEELSRTNRSLFWAGISAGILISFSVLGEAVLRAHLPDTEWRFILENFGYSLGFLLVILGRMQLFTENTLTTVLPFMVKPCWSLAIGVARLWALVLGANVIGAFLAAWFLAYSGGIAEDLEPVIRELSVHATGLGAWTSFARGIPAGLLIAAIVWIRPQAEASEVMMVTLFTWLIAAADLTHVVAGSVEMAYLMILGELDLVPAVFGFFLPVLAGNIIGGTAIFALMAWGQVRDDFVPPDAPHRRWQ